jgi:hypothetical protein
MRTGAKCGATGVTEARPESEVGATPIEIIAENAES